MIDLSPNRNPEGLIDALYAARRGDRRDLRAAVEQLLLHEEPIVREEALSLLLTKWEIPSLHATARELLEHDEDSGVRARAALGLASITSPQTRSEDAALLGRVFADNSAFPVVRRACAEALYFMVGRPTSIEVDDIEPGRVQALVEEVRRLSPSKRT